MSSTIGSVLILSIMLIILASHLSESAPFVMLGTNEEHELYRRRPEPKGLKPNTFAKVIGAAIDHLLGW